MQEHKPVTDSSELLHRISRLSSEAEWTTEELRDALREGGVDPDHLVRRVMTDIEPLLAASPHPQPTSLRPLLGALRQQTNLPPSAIAKAMDVSVTFLSAVSRSPKVVPERWRQELASRAERALQVDQRLVMASLTQPFQYELAASRDTPYATEVVRSYEDILERADMPAEARQYWRTLAEDASG
jgi:hypothetical protein